MAQLIYLPLLLATIQLPLVSETVETFPPGGVNYTISKECKECPDQWITTLYFRPDRWILKVKCCKPLVKKLRVVVLPLGSTMPIKNNTSFNQNLLYQSNSFDINLKEVNGCVKPCYRRSEICMIGAKMDVCTNASRSCKRSIVNDECTYLRNGTIHISVPSTYNSTVKIQFKANTMESPPITTQHQPIKCTGLRFYKKATSWIDALKHCHKANSSLVHITNNTVQEDVEFHLENNYRKIDLQKGVWIGLERSIFGCNVPWMWTSGTKVEYQQWNSSFPVDPVNNHCGKIIWVNESKTYKWLDAHCFEKLPFICQDAT